MRVEPLGDRAYILRDLETPPFEIAAWLNLKKPAGLVEAVASYETVGLYVEGGFDPGSVDLSSLVAGSARVFAALEPPHHRIPVCYALGEDLVDAASSLGMSPGQLVEGHSGATYTCHAVGFCPGFAYLGYLPDSIAGVPRRASPRTRVEPGSVGITGRQTGVYPLPRPGGWAIIGRTPLTLVDVADAFFPIQAGDTVEFVSIGPEEFEARRGERL
ncbi:MAG TPA: carboxyltransferase domain-containing protein [Fimbriimonadaceae bacterium]|nr:carboxyltransferase domain-containing protein [Fimbriimonadaceae bacterium]